MDNSFYQNEIAKVLEVKIKLIREGFIPIFKHSDDACADCYANINNDEGIIIEKGCRKLIPLGFALALPNDYEAVIRPRSGRSLQGVDVCIGTIDAGYRGEVNACVVNNTDSSIKIFDFDRVCQLAIRKISSIKFEICKELNETERGENGFGSTGV